MLHKEQQARMLYLTYHSQEVFLLGNENIGFCDQLYHTISTPTNPLSVPAV